MARLRTLLRAAVVGLMAAMALTDMLSLSVLYVAAFVLGVEETLFDTAAQSIMPNKVGKKLLSRANSRLLRPVARRLREIVFEVDPDAVEVVRLGDRAATYGLGPRKMSEGYCYALPYGRRVNAGFFRGAELVDAEGLLEGTGTKLRHVKVRSLEAADDPAIRSLIEAARLERKAALGRGPRG